MVRRITVYTMSCPHCGYVISKTYNYQKTEGLPHQRCPRCKKTYRTGRHLSAPPSAEECLNNIRELIKYWGFTLGAFLLSLSVAICTAWALVGLLAFFAFLALVALTAAILSDLFPKRLNVNTYIRMKQIDPELYYLNYHELIKVFPELKEE